MSFKSLIVFLAGDLVWRDREARVDPLTDPLLVLSWALPLLPLLQIPAAGFLLLVLLLLGMTFRIDCSGLPLYGGLALAKVTCGLGLTSRLLGLQGLEQTVVLLGAAHRPPCQSSVGS